MRKVETTPAGRYKVRFRHGVNKSGSGLRQASETFDTHREATQFARWLDALGPQGALDKLYAEEQAAAVPILDQVAADHCTHLEAGDGHRVKQQRLWERTWGPRIGYIRADEITRDQIVAAFADLARNGKREGVGYKPKSLENQRGLLHGVLTRVVEKEYLRKHPALKLSLPETTTAMDADDYDDVEDMVCMTPGQFELLYAAMSPHYQAIVRFMVGTGCRWGEVVELRTRDLRLSDDLPAVTIRRALKWSPDGKHRVGPPKTKRSRRTIVLPAEVTADLRALAADKAPGDLVFAAPRGGRIWHRTFWSDHWRPALWRAQRCAEHTDPACRCGTAHPKRCTVHEAPPGPCGCPGTLTERPRIHDLRHTHASWLLARGVPIHVVSARLGHESIKTTVDTYGHLLPDAQLAAADAASLAFRAVDAAAVEALT